MAWTQWICSTDGVEIITIEINLDFRWKCEVYSQSVNIQYPLLIVHILSEQTSKQKIPKTIETNHQAKKKYKKQSNNKKILQNMMKKGPNRCEIIFNHHYTKSKWFLKLFFGTYVSRSHESEPFKIAWIWIRFIHLLKNTSIYSVRIIFT